MRPDGKFASIPRDTGTGAASLAAAGGALRIAGVDPELGFGGGESQVLGLSVELIRMGHRAELLCDPRGELWRRARTVGILCHPLTVRNSLDLRAGIALRRLLRDQRFDLVHFHTARAHALAPYAQRMAGALIVTRRMDYRPNRYVAPWLYGRAVDKAAAISRAVAQSLIAAGVPERNIEVVPSGVDCERFAPPNADARSAARAAIGLSPEEVAIGAVGSLQPRKGHRYLIEALAILARRGLRPRCLIAGDGPLRAALNQQAAAAGLSEQVSLLGSLADPRTLFWALDIYVQPSLKEGLGVALMEAMACGLAVIASRAGGMAELIEDEVSGRLFPAADPAALSHALEELTLSQASRERTGQAARARIAEHFSMAAMARRTLALYLAALGKRRTPCEA